MVGVDDFLCVRFCFWHGEDVKTKHLNFPTRVQGANAACIVFVINAVKACGAEHAREFFLAWEFADTFDEIFITLRIARKHAAHFGDDIH